MADQFEVSAMSRMLGKVSEVMADGYHFVKMRELCEQWHREDGPTNVNADGAQE
jgi:hypothetical protein